MMTELLCPVCGCSIAGGGYEKEGAAYCCKPCATGTACECGCCSVEEEPSGEE